MKLYENIRAKRIALQMTQQELAKKLGYKSTSTIAKIESGENDIPQAKLAAFASALNTTPAELMGLQIVTLGPEEPDDTETVAISKGKPQLVELIHQLDSLSEKNLNRVISVVNPLIENFLSGEDFHMVIKSESRPVE
ncbi:MAG: helix-turn-helix transcriptional regulator [Acidaminococcaceae bacterium]|nr:helix-turn-helix transcriptional regulator [Acidaminococcaceae bacterium]